MGEFEAIAWVIGGLISIITIYNLLDKFFALKNKNAFSLQRNWEITEELQKQFDILVKLCETNQRLIEEVIFQRNAKVGYELAKTQAVDKLLDLHQKDHPETGAILANIRKEHAKMEAEIYKRNSTQGG